MGVEPWAFTLRELIAMCEARRRDAWDHTAQLLAFFYNSLKRKQDPTAHPAQFNPLVESKPIKHKHVIKAANIRDLAALVPIGNRNNGNAPSNRL